MVCGKRLDKPVLPAQSQIRERQWPQIVGERMMRLKIEGLLIVLVASLWCSGCSRPASKATTLPSGKKINITSIVPMHFSNGGNALLLNCETDISIDDSVALRKEADEIWGIFKINVENANLTNGIIRMVHPEGSGLITHIKGYGFVFVKRADGEWHCLQDEKK
jgi:hypothetical protein